MARRIPGLTALWPGKQRLLFGSMLGLVLLAPAFPQDMEKETSDLAEKISRVLAAKGKKKVAVTDFADLQGRPTELGRFLAEQISVDLVNAPGVSVMDRANLKSILAEHKLSEEGLVNPETAKQLGQFAGVDVIILGTVTALDDSYAVTVKGVATDTAEIVVASKVTLSRTKETQQLAMHSVAAAGGSNVYDSTQAPPIVTKDFGDLRVALQSVQRTQARDGWRTVDGVEVDFNLTNTNLKEGILCAGNGQANQPNSVRAELRNPYGNVLTPMEIRGISSVCVYGHGASPATIGQMVMNGRRLDGPRAYYPQERLWEGNFTSIPPGQTVNVAIVFGPGRELPRQPIGVDNLHLDFEFVVGTGSRMTMDSGPANLPARARLYTLSLDGLNVQKPGAAVPNAN